MATATLTTTEYEALLRSSKRRVAVKMYLFDPIGYTGPAAFPANIDLSADQKPVTNISPSRWIAGAPGDTITVDGADSYERGGPPAPDTGAGSSSLLESLTVTLLNAPTTTSTVVLQSGINYKIRLIGQGKYGVAAFANVSSAYGQAADLSWSAFDALAINGSNAGRPDTDVLDLATQTYDYTIAGTGSTVALKNNLTPSSDDSGTWTAEIRQISAPPAQTPTITPTYSQGTNGANVSRVGTVGTVTLSGNENTVDAVTFSSTSSNGTSTAANLYINTSSRGWNVASGTLSIEGSFAADGWSGTLTVPGNTVNGLVNYSILLIKMDTYYDGVKINIGGDTLGVFRVMPWAYREDHNGNMTAVIPLESPASLLKVIENYAVLPEVASSKGAIRYSTAASASTTRYWTDVRVTDAILDLLTQTGVNEYFNAYVFHDPNTYDNFQVAQGNIFDQIKSLAESIGGVLFCDRFGSLTVTPAPHIRRGDWWGTPTPIWSTTSNGPLTEDFMLDWEVVNSPGEKQIGGPLNIITLRGYNSSGSEIVVTRDAGVSTGIISTNEEGYLIPSYIVANTWAGDLITMYTRSWDFVGKHAFIGNVAGLGVTADVSVTNKQTGQANATGTASMNAIKHDINLGAGTHISTIHWTKV